MKNRCRCSNSFNSDNLANWDFPSREEGNRKFTRCRKCNQEWEAFLDLSKEGAPLNYWIAPDISPGNNKE